MNGGLFPNIIISLRSRTCLTYHYRSLAYGFKTLLLPHFDKKKAANNDRRFNFSI
jgi:hypothetical protein